MEASTLSRVFTSDPCTRRMFHGHLACDTPIDKLLFTPALFVLNTDKSTGPGEHWCIAIIFDRDRTEFFDSFGKKPSHYGFDKILLPHTNHIFFNEYPVQTAFSSTCGHHCIFWALHRSHGKPANEIMKFYTSDCVRNDRMVHGFVCYHFGADAAFIRH